jgi:hypothetical protein
MRSHTGLSGLSADRANACRFEVVRKRHGKTTAREGRNQIESKVNDGHSGSPRRIAKMTLFSSAF